MSSTEFDAFMRELKNGFASERMKTIDRAKLTTGFTTAQCKELLKLFPFTSEKIEFLKTMYPSVTDKNKYFEAVNVLAFSSDRDKVWGAVKKYAGR